MQLTLTEFQQRVLPLLRETTRDGDLQHAIKTYLGTDGKIVDKQGQEVEIEVLAPIRASITTAAPTEPTEPTEPAAGGGGQANLRQMIDAAVKDIAGKMTATRRPALPAGDPKARTGRVPQKAKRWAPTTLRAFKGADREDAEYRAYSFGMWFIDLATKGASKEAVDWLEAENIPRGRMRKAMTEGSNIAGGALVPEEFSTDLIRLVETYGVFRREAAIEPMMRDTKLVPRRTGGLTAYAVGEGGAITTSDVATDNVGLTARKWGTLTRISNELDEDAAISLGDLVATEIALSFANKEDDAGFNGDGTSTFHGIYGLTVKIDDGNHTAGVHQIASGTAFSSVAMSDVETLIGLLPTYALDNAKWYAHQAGFANVIMRLGAAQGGVTWAETQDGPQLLFLGFPVVRAQVLPATAVASDIILLLGDLRLSSRFGDRKTMEIATSTERYFDQDQLAIRGIERYDIQNHDLGDTSSSGPMTALKLAAS